MTTPATSTPRPASELGSAHGRTTIADAVVSKVAVEQMTGLQVVEVNIDVTDLQLPGDESDDEPRRPEPARVS